MFGLLVTTENTVNTIKRDPSPEEVHPEGRKCPRRMIRIVAPWLL